MLRYCYCYFHVPQKVCLPKKGKGWRKTRKKLLTRMYVRHSRVSYFGAENLRVFACYTTTYAYIPILFPARSLVVFFVVFCNHGIYQYTYVYRLHLCVHLWLSLGMGTYYVRCPSFPSSVFSIFLLLSLSELCMACTIKTLDGFCLSRNQTSLYVNSQLFSLSQPCEAF